VKKDKKKPCEDCGELTDLRGWVFVSPKRKRKPDENYLDFLYKRYIWWCTKHYPIHMFNLYPYQCTDECREAHSEKIGIVLRPEDSVVWIRLVNLLSQNPRPAKPKCPWCRKAMKPTKN
jgi:hypothetical protein